MHTKSTAAYKPTVRLTAHRGWYRVQSGTDPNVFYETSANSCSCPARKPCKHMRFVRSLNVAFFVKKEAEEAPVVAVPMSAGAPSGIKRPVMGQPVSTIDNALDDADRRLGAAYRALADAHEQSDERAVLLRQVDSLEREIAALHSQAIRYAA